MRTTVYMPDKLHELLSKYATLHGTNNSELICKLVKDHLTNPFNWEDLNLYEALAKGVKEEDNE